MDESSLNYDPNYNLNYAADSSLATEYLANSTGYPVYSYGNQIPTGTTVAQLGTYMPTTVNRIIIYDPATMLFQLAINYGLNYGWYLYPTMYNYRSMYGRYPRDWRGFGGYIRGQYDGYGRGHREAVNYGHGRGGGRAPHNDTIRGTRRFTTTSTPVRSTQVNRSGMSSPSSSPVIRRTTASPIRSNQMSSAVRSSVGSMPSPVRSNQMSSAVRSSVSSMPSPVRSNQIPRVNSNQMRSGMLSSPSSSPIMRQNTASPIRSNQIPRVNSNQMRSGMLSSPSSSPIMRQNTASPVRSSVGSMPSNQMSSPVRSNQMNRSFSPSSSPVIFRTNNSMPSSSPVRSTQMIRSLSPSSSPVMRRTTSSPVRSGMNYSPNSSPRAMPSMFRQPSSPGFRASSPRTMSSGRSFSGGGSRPSFSGGGGRRR
jgi:hypothetical protein